MLECQERLKCSIEIECGLIYIDCDNGIRDIDDTTLAYATEKEQAESIENDLLEDIIENYCWKWCKIGGVYRGKKKV